jgi:hypothetical protein
MVSGKASRRSKAEQDSNSHSGTAGAVEHAQVAYWPQYFWLYEHTTKHTVIRIPGPQDMLEVTQMMWAACKACTHPDLLGECIHIEKATFDDWLETHPA